MAKPVLARSDSSAATRPEGLAAANGRGLRVRTLVPGVAVVVAGVLPGFLTAALATRIRTDFAFSDSTLGLAMALFYTVSAIVSSPAGWLVERIGAVRAMRLAAALVAVSALCIAVLAGSAPVLIALLVAGAVGNGLASPGVSALLSRDVRERRRGLAFGAQQAGAPAGSLLAGAALPLLAVPFGWRWAFVAAALWALVAAFAVPAPAPERSPSRPGRADRADRPGRPVYLIALGATFASAAGMGMVSFLVVFSVASGLSESAAGLLLAGVSLASVASRVGLGAAADRPHADPLRIVMAIQTAGALGFIALIPGDPALVVLGALAAGGVAWAWPGLLTLAVVRITPAAPAAAVGVMMTGLFVGGVGGPLVVGLLAEQRAYTAAWLVCASFAIAAAGAVLWADRSGPRPSARRAGRS